jgi:DNA-binding IclR family transcriptional regulator
VLDAHELEELRKFLLEHVEGLEDLEILARFRETPDGAWLTTGEVASLTTFPLATTQDALRRLAARGLLAPTATEPAAYRYARPASSADPLARVIAEYRSNPLQVMGLMTANAIERVRTSAMMTFAECFRIGGPKANG